MFRIIAVTAMAALAAAQSEFSANDGSINIEGSHYRCSHGCGAVLQTAVAGQRNIAEQLFRKFRSVGIPVLG